VKTFLAAVAIGLSATIATANDAVEEIVVTSSRAPTARHLNPANIALLGSEAVKQAVQTHPYELFSRVAGVWVTRGSGQENLPSIRSPVLVGAGSCGAFLTLEDGVPSRPNGFCNVNQLFELPTELAKSIEIVRGPGNALYGSNALHGIINVLLPNPLARDFADARLELGPNDFVRLTGGILNDGGAPTALGGVIVNDGGFREDSGYRQLKGYLKKSWRLGEGSITVSLSASDLNQETAGYIFGKDAYKDPKLNRQNLNPEAFRNANSQRLTLRWLKSGNRFDLDVRPYLRRSEMEFLQHFLPGKPLEENGHTSFGVLTNLRQDKGKRTLSFGLDMDVSDVYLRETQYGPTEGSDFLRETRPQGKHYDYDVEALSVAVYAQSEFRVSPRVTLTGGVRAEYTHYDYDNGMIAGNTRDDGAECGFGGCLYTRPASRGDSFSDIAPKAGVLLRLSNATVAYVNIARGFRAPQMTELYRLQNGQQVSDLDSESIDSLEVGLRIGGDTWRIDGSLFAMRKENSVFRDTEGFNVNGGRSRHRGVEVAWDARFGEYWSLAVNGTYAQHRYDFDVVALRGETFVSGRDVDTAPRWQGSAELRFDSLGRIDAALQWVSMGSYYLDAENRYTYPGHDIQNLRISYGLSDRLRLTASFKNIADIDYADRADFAFGNYRYFPARGREVFLQLEYSR
jgi:outer membrane receptor protein involved in Fe transport